MRRLTALVPALLLLTVSAAPTPAPVPAQPEAAPVQPEALPATFGVFADQTIDYTAHIIVVTGRVVGVEMRCGFTGEVAQCVLIPIVGGGPAVLTTVMLVVDNSVKVLPGRRFTATNQSNCDSINAAVILTQLAPEPAPLTIPTVDEMAAPEGLTTLGFFFDTTIDYSAHIILLTGKSFGFGRVCFEDGEFRQVVLIPTDGGPAFVSTMLIVDPFFDWKTGTRYHAGGQFNCGASIAQVILQQI